MSGPRPTSLGLRLGLGASLLVATATGAVALGLLAGVSADLHRDLELRSGAVASGLARAAAPLLAAGDRAALDRLLGEAWDVEDLARIEVRSAAGTPVAHRTFDVTGPEAAVVVVPITAEPDEEGFREAVGSVRVSLSAAGNSARQARYLRRATWVAGVGALVGVLLAATLAWALSRPLRRLEQAALGLAEGRYAGDLPTGGPREVARLRAVLGAAIAAVAQREAELQATNAQLQAANEQLRRTEEAREAMTHMLVHDLKGPLSNLLMVLDVIEGDVQPDDRALLQAGRSRCRGLIEMVEDLLTLGRLEAGHLDLARETLTGRGLVAGAVDQVTHLAEQKKFSLEIGPLDDQPFSGDRRLLERALVNLLVNALRHGRSPVRVRAEDDAGRLVLVVEDAGAGVPPALAERVFEKFQRGGPGGTGLGLALVRLAVQAHGGEVGVVGARFTLRLPREAP